MSLETEDQSKQHSKLQLAYPWIEDGLFKELLQIDFPTETVVIRKYFLKAALAAGENYSSQMIRAKVDYQVNSESRQINFIIKTAITDEIFDEKLASERRAIFDKEISAYTKVWPRVHELLKTIGDKTKLYGR